MSPKSQKPTEEASTDLAKIEPSPVVALALKPDQATMMAEAMKESLGEVASAFDFQSIDMPSGKTAAWTIPTLRGDVVVGAFNAVIVAAQDVRQYYDSPYGGEKSPPSCAAPDALIGQGTPGGNCSKCPLAQFGTAIDEQGNPGRGCACQLRRHILLLTEHNGLPYFLNVSPTSRSNGDREPDLRQFMMQIAGVPAFWWNAEVKIGLRSTKNAGGIDFQIATWELLQVFPEGSDQKAITDLFHNQTKNILQAKALAEVDGPPSAETVDPVSTADDAPVPTEEVPDAE